MGFWKSLSRKSQDPTICIVCGKETIIELTGKPDSQYDLIAKSLGNEKKLVCVHCGKALSRPDYTIYDSSVGLSYARCTGCFEKFRDMPIGTKAVLRKIQRTSKKRRRNAVCN